MERSGCGRPFQQNKNKKHSCTGGGHCIEKNQNPLVYFFAIRAEPTASQQALSLSCPCSPRRIQLGQSARVRETHRADTTAPLHLRFPRRPRTGRQPNPWSILTLTQNTTGSKRTAVYVVGLLKGSHGPIGRSCTWGVEIFYNLRGTISTRKVRAMEPDLFVSCIRRVLNSVLTLSTGLNCISVSK